MASELRHRHAMHGLSRRCRPSSPLLGRARVDRQRVDIGLHQFAEGGVHRAMTRERRLAAKRGADHADAEVPATIARTGVADVAMAVVLDIEFQRRQRLGQAGADLFDTIQGNTLRNGRTLTCA